MPKSSKPICRHFVNDRCRYGDKCRFYHPIKITRTIKKKSTRKIGHCYCGSRLRRVMNYSAVRDDDDRPAFFSVCGKTGRSMKRCI